MLDKVLRYIEEYRMVEKGDRILAGISGGADSAALLCMLAKLRPRLGFALYAVHVNHCLRGQEAERDARFVEQLCAEYGVPFVLCVRDVKKRASEQGTGTEETGRQMRMEVFGEQMRLLGANKLALAHHANDLAETMVHHLCRGTGLKGLCGIRPVQGEKIRPLLCLERREIEHYVRVNRIPYVHDSTNDCDEYTRNFIRHQVIPVMERGINPGTVRHMAAASASLCRADEYLSRQAEELLRRHWRRADGEELLGEEFFGEEQILQEYAVLQWIGQVCRTRRDVTAGHIGRILCLAQKPVGKYVELPGGYRVVRRYRGLLLEKNNGTTKKDTSLCCNLPVNGELCIPQGSFSTRLFSNSGQEIPEKKYTKWLNYDRIETELLVRTRRSGDYLRINTAGERKKLRDYFVDRKVPREERDGIPLIAAGSEILWAVGYRISETYKVSADTEKILEVNFLPAHKGGVQDDGKNQCDDQRGGSGRQDP